MSAGVNIIDVMMAIIEPIIVKYTAWCPFPWRRSWCPGNAAKDIEVSGAPKKIDGIAEVNVCVIAIEIIRIVNGMGAKGINGRDVRIRAVRRFVWIPGIKPVIVPVRIPMRIEIVISISIFLEHHILFRNHPLFLIIRESL